jgi:hypothetical protein
MLSLNVTFYAHTDTIYSNVNNNTISSLYGYDYIFEYNSIDIVRPRSSSSATRVRY